LKKNTADLGKKKTDITGYGWDEGIKNRLYWVFYINSFYFLNKK
jgi:hypothetical protein